MAREILATASCRGLRDCCTGNKLIFCPKTSKFSGRLMLEFISGGCRVQGNIMSSKDLPNDIVIDILSRLPVKSLIRFRCVCKSWYASIAHPSFITKHLNRISSSSTADYLQFIKRGASEEQIWCFLYDHTYENSVELELPFNCESDCFIIGTYYGLVCLSELSRLGNIIYLWNPSIRKFKTLPSSSINRNYGSLLGFGVHFQTNDFRVLKITYFRDLSWRFDTNLPPQVELYSLSTDSWKMIDTHVPGFGKFKEMGVFVNGSVHWLASKSDLNVHQSSDMIMSFDFGDEVFREIMLPDCSFDENVPLSMSLSVLKESLSLCVSFRYYADGGWTGQSHIWVMREYGVVESWTKQFTVVLGHGIVLRSLGFTKDNELLLQMVNRELISYDPESLQYKLISYDPEESLQYKQHETRGIPYKRNLTTFMETLVFLDGESALLERQNSFDGVNNERLCSGESRAVVEEMEEL